MAVNSWLLDMSIDIGQIIGVILAGGFGTRIRHLLPNIPKPMASVAGRPFVAWVASYLRSQGIEEIVLSTGYLAEVVEDYFALHPPRATQVSFCRETTALGTGGGFVNVVRHREKSPPAWLVTNGDSLIVTDIGPMLAYLEEETVSGVILGLSVADASRYGSLSCDRCQNLRSFAEKKPGAGAINAGVYLLRHSLVKQFPPQIPLSFEQEVFPHLLSQGVKLKVHVVEAPFLDIGTPESLAQAEEFIINNSKLI